MLIDEIKYNLKLWKIKWKKTTLNVEKSILELETRYNRVILVKKDISKYKKLVLETEKYLSFRESIYKSDRARTINMYGTEMTFGTDYENQLLRSRVYELKGLIKFAEDSISDAKELIILAIDKLPPNYEPISNLAKNYFNKT